MPIEISVGFILAMWIIVTYFSGSKEFENLALGNETASYQAVDNQGKLIHIVKIDKETGDEFLLNWKNRGSKNAILVLGNSQMHSINQMRKGDINYLELLHKENADDTLDIIGHSLPNAGLQEFYLTYTYWKDKLPIDVLVIPLFMDDMREDGVREVFFHDLISTRFQIKDSTDYLARRINSYLQGFWASTDTNADQKSKEDIAALDETFQEKTESYLNNRLEQNSKAWVNRQNVRGEFFTAIYKLRNAAFRINAGSVRRMIPQRYELNMHALELIIKDCSYNQRQVLLYIPPIRSDVLPPYDPVEYASFKVAMESLAQKNPRYIKFKNFETIVPASLWGYHTDAGSNSEKELDFMHFQFKAHSILADSLHATLNELTQMKMK